MTIRTRWDCPACGRAYSVPDTTGLTVCPKCQVDDLPLIKINPIKPPSERKARQPSKLASMISRLVGLTILILLFFLTLLVGSLFSETFDVVYVLPPIALGIYLYILPSLVAYRRDHRNLVPIIIVNLAFGWTLIGWIAALVWATATRPETEKNPNND